MYLFFSKDFSHLGNFHRITMKQNYSKGIFYDYIISELTKVAQTWEKTKPLLSALIHH